MASFGFRRILEGLRLIPRSSNTTDELGDLQVTESDSRLNFHNGTTSSPVLTISHEAQGANAVKNKDLDDATTLIVDSSDTTKQMAFDASGTTGTKTTIIGSQTANRSITLPDISDTLTANNATQTLTNKSLVDNSTTIVDDGDNTKKAQFQVSGITTGTTRTFAFPDSDTTLVGTDTTQTLTNKTLTAPIINGATISVIDSNFSVLDNADNTKILKFEASGITTGTTRTLTAPDASTTIVGTDATQTLTNKTITIASSANKAAIYDGSNNLSAETNLAVTRGGTGAGTLTTNNVILGNGTSAVQFVAPSTSGNVLTSNGTTWLSSPSAGGGSTNSLLTRSNTNNNYTLLSTDNTIVWSLTNGLNNTVNLPSASANTGKLYNIVSHNGNNSTTLSIAAADGFVFMDTSTSVAGPLVIYTTGEQFTLQSNGVTWYVIGHKCDTDWESFVASYNFTPNGFGSISDKSFRWRRVGTDMEVSFSFNAGTTAATAASITLPITIDTSRLPSTTSGCTLFGLGVVTASGSNVFASSGQVIAFYYNGTATRVDITKQANADGTSAIFSGNNANQFVNTSGSISGTFKVPVTGWLP